MIRDFNPSPPTVGLELEWQLVSRSTLDLEDGIVPLLSRLPGEPLVKPEVLQATVETITAPMRSTAALRPALLDTVARVHGAARQLDMDIVGAGTHPFCVRHVQTTPMPRYLALARAVGYLAHTMAVQALHVHVGMPSGEAAIRVMGRARGALPVLLALSASSPLFHGEETGFVSYRHRILAATRNYGIAPAFTGWPEFQRFLDTVERAGMFGSFRDMHWDLRPRPDLGTLEVRIMDAQPTVADSLALGALVHALLAGLIDEDAPDPRLPGALPWWIEKENAFRASQAGLEAELVIDPEGHVMPLREMAEHLFELAWPGARALGEEDDLRRAARMIEEGPCAARQVAIFRSTRSAQAVVQALAEELREEIGAAMPAAA
jgi:carboxylate-amine ligase